jgi:hypothetical protein
MPVTTRSQAKILGISPNSSENMSMSPVRLAWNHPSISSSTVEHLDSLLTLPPSDFVDLVKHHHNNNSISNGIHSEISKFQTLKYLTPPRVPSSIHNFETSQFLSIEADFKQYSVAEMASSNNSSSPSEMNSSNNVEIITMLSNISSQMTSNYQALQENIVKNDQHLSTNIQTIAQEMDLFKQQVRAELDTLRNIVPQAHCSGGSNQIILQYRYQVLLQICPIKCPQLIK